MAAKQRVGFIFECGPYGPDYKVCHHFLGRLNAAIEMVPRFMDNKRRLMNECGEVAAALLREDKCSRVVVTWDLEPAWGGKACRHDDKELEGWLMTDGRALGAVLGKLKHPHPVGNLPAYNRPDRDIQKPKSGMISLFQRELGKGRRYLDRDHALLLAQSVPDWSKLKRSESFCRFAEKAANVRLK